MKIGKRIKNVVLSQAFLTILLTGIIFLEMYGLFRDVHAPVPVMQQYHGINEDIEPWMSIGYINFMFKLPDNYLKEQLHITEGDYPNIRLKRIAMEENIPFDQLRTRIDLLIREYRK